MSGWVICLCPQLWFGLSVTVCVRLPLLDGNFVGDMSVVASMSLAASVWVERGRLASGYLVSTRSAMDCC
jgi:hypothetical protein